MWLDSNVSEQDALSYIKVDVNNRCKYDNIVSGFKSIPGSFEVPFDWWNNNLIVVVEVKLV